MIDLSELEKNDVDVWMNHPCTKWLVEQLQENKQDQVQKWIGGRFTGETADATLQMNSQAIAYVQLIDEILDNIQDIKTGDTV